MIRYRRGMLNPEQEKIFASLTCNTRVRVRFAEITDPIWIYNDPEDGTPCLNDADQDCLYPATLVDIVQGRSDEWIVTGVSSDRVVLKHATRNVDEDNDELIGVTPAHLRELEVIEAGDRWNHRETAVKGLSYTFVQHADGILEVGCQRIPREGQEQIVRLLAERLDLEVRPVGFGDEGAKVSSALAALVSHLHCLPTSLTDFLGDDLYEQVMRALGRDDVLGEDVEDVEDDA